MASSLYKILNIEKEEATVVFLFLVQSVFLGIYYGALDVAAHALFLDAYPTHIIPKAYIVSGIAGILLTTLYTRLQAKLPFSVFVVYNLIFVAILTTLLWTGFFVMGEKIVAFAIFVFFTPLFILGSLGFWGGVARVFSLRQGKRIFGLIDSGMIIGIILSSYATTILLSFSVKTKDLLLLSAGSTLGALLLQLFISKYLKKEQTTPVESTELKSKNRFSSLMKNRFVLIMSVFVSLSVIATFFIHYTFLSAAKDNYPDTVALAKFLGAFTGTVMMVSLLVKTLVYGRLVKTYGLRFALVISPILLIVFTALCILLGNTMGFTSAASGFIMFFLVVSLTKLFSKTLRDSVEAPSFKVLYQSVDPDIRYSVQAGVDGTINEISAFSSGIILLGLVSLPFIQTIHFTYILAIFLGVWVWIAFVLYREYRKSLQKSLEGYQSHQNTETKIIPEEFFTRYSEKNPFFQEVSLALGLVKYEKSDAGIRDEKVFDNLAISRTPAEREKAALMLEKLNHPERIKWLKIFLRDTETQVKKAALFTIGNADLSELTPSIVEFLSHPVLYAQAFNSLQKLGESSLDYLDVYFHKTGLDEQVQKRILRLYGKIQSDKSKNLLVAKLDGMNKVLVKEATAILRQKAETSFTETELRKIQKAMMDALNTMAWNQSAIASLSPASYPALHKALNEEIHNSYVFLMDLLSLAFDEKSVMLVKENLESGTKEGAGYALELMDLFVPDEMKRFIFPVLEENTGSEKIRQLQEEYPVIQMDEGLIFRSLLCKNENELSISTLMVALDSFAASKQTELPPYLVAHLFNKDPFIAETALGTIYKIQPSELDNYIERAKNSSELELENTFKRISSDADYYSPVRILMALKENASLQMLKLETILKMMRKGIVWDDHQNKKEILIRSVQQYDFLFVLRGALRFLTSTGEIYTLSQGELHLPSWKTRIQVQDVTIEKDTLVLNIPFSKLTMIVFDTPEFANFICSTTSLTKPAEITA